METHHLKGGAIIIGSLLWQDHLKLGRSDNIRREWRRDRLNTDARVLVRLPIRYGRYSDGSIYTMAFSRECEAADRWGTGYVIPFKALSLNENDLIEASRAMANAEGMESRFFKTWASLGILVNATVSAVLREAIAARWKLEFEAAGGGSDVGEYRVGGESATIDQAGVLQIPWPTAVNPKDAPAIQQLDFLIASATKPKHETDTMQYPSADDIARSVRRDKTRRYFCNNVKNSIGTFQDEEVFKCLPDACDQGHAGRPPTGSSRRNPFVRIALFFRQRVASVARGYRGATGVGRGFG